MTSTTQDLTGLTDDVEFSYGYDVLGRKTSVAAKVGSTDDYVNSYSYDNLDRITQDGVSAVARFRLLQKIRRARTVFWRGCFSS